VTKDLISKRTRNEFREFLVGWKLREIEAEFESAGIKADLSHNPNLSGERRTLVEQYYHTLNFTSPADARRLVAIYESVLTEGERRSPSQFDAASSARVTANLIACLHKDGLRYRDGKIVAVTPEANRIFEGEGLRFPRSPARERRGSGGRGRWRCDARP
jgi:hypothetical protein